MSLFQRITEGGQLATHSVRMFKQVTKTSIIIAFFLWIMVFAYQMRDVDTYSLQNIWYYELSRMYKAFGVKTIPVNQRIKSNVNYDNRIIDMPVLSVMQMTKPHADRTYQILKIKFKRSVIYALMPLSVLFAFFFYRGRQSSKKHHMKGNKLSSAWLLRKKLKWTFNASKITIGSLPLVKGTETQHILITGGTGSGKTNCLHHLLRSIRKEQQRAVIVDTTGILTECYYRPDKDLILNPLDLRGQPWHPWIECSDVTSYATLAESFIPQSLSESDNYWRTCARLVLSSLLEQSAQSSSNFALAEKILRKPLTELCNAVKGTKAASVIDIASEKTAASIRSVLSSFTSFFEFLPDTTNPFSIRKWIGNGTQDQWLFINCKPNQRAALNPLLTCWFSVAVRSMLELPPDFHRRMWFIIDELPTLNRIKDLEPLLTESRKYGGCAVLSLQSPAQLDAIYGHATTQTIMGNCGTKIVFAEQNPVNAEKISEIFGEQEIKEYQKGLSYGANDVRDGVNLNQQVRRQALITKTDIQFLSRNQAYIRLPDNYPIVRMKFPIIK